MDRRLLFIADHIREVDTVTALCEQYGISRKTAYKWIKRYQTDGLDGLQERMSTPHHCPHKTPYAIEEEIVRLKEKLLTRPGPKKIRVLLAQKFPETPIPSVTTIHNILNRRGLVAKQKKRRKVAPTSRPFAPVHEPNDLWSIDYKGQFRLSKARQWCYPLTIMDHQSRYLLSCESLSGTRLKDAQRVMTRLFKDNGLPLRIRSDNGTPFASTSCAGLSQLSIWWIKLGITPERIDMGEPQQNGAHERMHKTLKAAACQNPAPTLQEQQKHFNQFLREYNEIRPHEALEQQTPAQCYCHSPREFPRRLPSMEYPEYYVKLKVCDNGVSHWGSKRLYTTHLLKNEYIGLNQLAEGVWCVLFGSVPLGAIDLNQSKNKTTGYFSLNV